MHRVGLSAVVPLVVVLLMASPAWAACVQADVAGAWRVYINGASADGGFWTWCRITISDSGAVAATGGSCQNSDGEVEAVRGGRLNVTSPSACVVKGSVITSGSGTHTISDSALDRSKDVLTGVGRDGDGSPWTFSAVKR